MLSEKTVFITGCGRGIGKTLLEVFSKNNAKTIFANEKSEGALDEMCQQLNKKYSTEIIPLYFDVSDPIAVKDAFKKLIKKTKQLDVLINNAGILESSLLIMLTSDVLQKTFEVNVFGTVYMMQYATRLMSKNKYGSIINISSIMGVNGADGQVAYSGSKAAILGITKSASKELASSGIRVNAIAPGFINTKMAKDIPEDKYNERIESIKMGRIGTSEEVANTALFLSSNLSEYVTGQIIGVDGGMII